MEGPDMAAQEYTLTLAELKTNNKTQINLLTILAEDYKESAEQIVDAIETHLLTVPPTQKLTVMYVCDSILKNVKKPNDYDKLFARKIVNMFEHVFRQGDEKVRTSLYKLRVTWASTGVFMPSKLYALDMKINVLDTAWPISNPRTGRALRDDPSVAAPVTTPTSAASTSSSTASRAASSGAPAAATASSSNPRVFVNPRFLESGDTSSATTTTTTPTSRRAERTTTPGSLSNSGAAPTSTSTPTRAATIQRPIKKEPKIDPLFSDKLLPTPNSSATTGASPAKSSSAPSSSKRKAIPTEHSNAPNRKKQQGSSGSSSSSSAGQKPLKVPKDEDLRSIGSRGGAPLRGGAGAGGSAQQQQQDQDFRSRPLKPTSVVGSHAFAPRPLMAPPMTAGPPPTFHRNSPPQDPAPLMIPPLQQQLQGGVPYQGPPRGPPPMPLMQQGPPPNAPPPAAAPQKHVYASEATKLDVPANNRIFVEGKAYEVMFVDDTAVIERGGAPHRIYFAGAPRNLIIDGISHLLPFDTNTTIDINGAKHVVKFGAPSRELYIGGHPFKGQFGGPPIVATINGRRHEIRLTGSAPEVRIEPEPAYHLTRFLHKMREEKKNEITAEKPKDTGDWLAYLKNLQKTGILPPVKSSSSPRHHTPPPMGQQGMQQQRGGRQNNRGMRGGGQWSGKPTMMPEHQPPPPPPTSSSSSAISSSTGVEKRHVPPAAITDFNIRLLQIRYDTVVEMLVTKRADACKFCGMRLDDSNGKSKEWQDHMDWHVKQNLSRGNNSDQATFRLWYPTAANWLTARASDQPTKAETRDEPLPGVASSGVKAKECAVCQEKFDEYFDDDEETWRLRDTVVIHGKIVHASCADDASLMDVTPSVSYHENPFFAAAAADEVKQELMEVDDNVIGNNGIAVGDNDNDDEEDIKRDVKNIISSFEQKNALSSR